MTSAPLDWTNALETCEDGALGVCCRRLGTFVGPLRGGKDAYNLGWLNFARQKNTGPAGMPFAGVSGTRVDVRSYLVDPASSHMLVSKIKPCMSKYKQHLYCETANGSLNQL